MQKTIVQIDWEGPVKPGKLPNDVGVCAIYDPHGAVG